jgi:hypothetical protein
VFSMRTCLSISSSGRIVNPCAVPPLRRGVAAATVFASVLPIVIVDILRVSLRDMSSVLGL